MYIEFSLLNLYDNLERENQLVENSTFTTIRENMKLALCHLK